jgi:hypothetical protein
VLRQERCCRSPRLPACRLRSSVRVRLLQQGQHLGLYTQAVQQVLLGHLALLVELPHVVGELEPRQHVVVRSTVR